MNTSRKHITGAVAGLLSLGLVAAGVASLDSASASTSTRTTAAATSAVGKAHTEHFVVIAGDNHGLGENKFGGIDVNKSGGKVVGFDTISGTLRPAQQELVIDVAISRKGGLIFGHIVQDFVGHVDGKVTGGTGAFKGVSGTITGHVSPQNEDRTLLTMTFQR